MSCPAGFQALPLPIVQLSLAAVLKCGQSFRWSILPLPQPKPTEPNHEYRFCLRDRLVCLRQSPSTLYYPLTSQPSLKRRGNTLWLNDYFQLEVDLEQLYRDWAARDAVFSRFQGRFGGIRMLRQDPWENLISFICSSNNNIARITKMVQNLCSRFSPPLLSTETPDGEIHTYHPFPPPSALAGLDVSTTLRTLGFGYRANFIQRTAEMLVSAHGSNTSFQDPVEASEKWLEKLRAFNTSEAREELLKFVGVGRKVADCVLLMSLDKKEVVPVDTHVHQIAVKYYGMKDSARKTNMTPKLYGEVNAKLFAIWGEYAGWAHSILFTADLKSFSAYGLPSSNSETLSSPANIPQTAASTLSAPSKIPPLAPLKQQKRKRKHENTSLKTEDDELPTTDHPPDTSLADRVKKRRRVGKAA
ncbi:DNA glycosylase [Infundibulicybe gibba]|nr:DNA glycosylase [Infundibulicybe gibba]